MIGFPAISSRGLSGVNLRPSPPARIRQAALTAVVLALFMGALFRLEMKFLNRMLIVSRVLLKMI
jgi:hypothetical protein